MPPKTNDVVKYAQDGTYWVIEFPDVKQKRLELKIKLANVAGNFGAQSKTFTLTNKTPGTSKTYALPPQGREACLKLHTTTLSNPLVVRSNRFDANEQEFPDYFPLKHRSQSALSSLKGLQGAFYPCKTNR